MDIIVNKATQRQRIIEITRSIKVRCATKMFLSIAIRLNDSRLFRAAILSLALTTNKFVSATLAARRLISARRARALQTDGRTDGRTDGPIDRPTDPPTDTPSNRVVGHDLKSKALTVITLTHTDHTF